MTIAGDVPVGRENTARRIYIHCLSPVGLPVPSLRSAGYFIYHDKIRVWNLEDTIWSGILDLCERVKPKY